MRIAISGPEGTGKSALAAALATELEVPLADPIHDELHQGLQAFVGVPTTVLGLYTVLRDQHPKEYLNTLRTMAHDLEAEEKRHSEVVSAASSVDLAALATMHCHGPGQWQGVHQFVRDCIKHAIHSYELIFYLDPVWFVGPAEDRRVTDEQYLATVDLTIRGLYQRAELEIIQLTETTITGRMAQALPVIRNGPYRRLPHE